MAYTSADTALIVIHRGRVLELRANGDGILKIGRKLGIGTGVVQRVFKQEPQPSS
jgi:hypothetical protein